MSLCTGYLTLCYDFCRMWEKHTLEWLRAQAEGDTGGRDEEKEGGRDKEGEGERIEQRVPGVVGI